MSGMKRVLRALRLDKIAAVDFPCQEHASADILKRAEPAATASEGVKMAKAYYDALRKVGFTITQDDEDEGAENFTETLQEQQLTEAFWSSYYQGTSALQESLLSILKDDTVTDKQPLIAESIKQFADYIGQIMPGDIGKSLAAGIAASAGTPGNLLSKGVPMSDELKKALGLPATATDADVLKAVQDNSAALVKANDDLEKAKKPAADAEPDADDMAKALSSGDAFKTPEGRVITKKLMGNDTAFDLAKSQNDRIVKNEAEIAKAHESAEETAFAKRATDLGFTAEFGSTMRKAYGGDAGAQTEIEKQFKALNAQVAAGEVFKNFGHSAPIEGSAQAELMAKVDEVKKASPNLTDAQAYTKAYTAPANRDIVKRMKVEAQA